MESIDGYSGSSIKSVTPREAGAPDKIFSSAGDHRETQLARMDLLSEGHFYLLWDRDRHRLSAQVFTTSAGLLMFWIFVYALRNMILRRRLIVISNWPDIATRATVENRPVTILCMVPKAFSPSLSLGEGLEVFAVASEIPVDLREYLRVNSNLPLNA